MIKGFCEYEKNEIKRKNKSVLKKCILIFYNYKFKNLNVDIAVFDEDKIKYFILFNENIIDKLQENIKWFYFEPEKFIEHYKDDEYFYPICDKSNLNGIDHPNKKCNDCIEGSSKDKLIKYKNIKKNY